MHLTAFRLKPWSDIGCESSILPFYSTDLYLYPSRVGLASVNKRLLGLQYLQFFLHKYDLKKRT